MLRSSSALLLLAFVGGPGPVRAAHAAPEPVFGTDLARGTLLDPDQLPPALMRPLAALAGLGGALEPKSLVIKPTGLAVDWDGDGRVEISVRAGKPAVLRAPTAGGAPVPLLCFDRAGAWWVAPASLLRGELNGKELDLLDADLDERFDGPGDFVRWDQGAFFRPTAQRLLPVGERVAVLALALDGATRRATLTPQEPPARAEADALRGLGAVNSFRNRVGLAPLRLDPAWSSGCRRHAEYIRLNPVDGFGHDEQPGRPGYSPEGREAAIEGVMERTGDPARAVERLTAMMMHRTPFLADPSAGFGAGAVGPAPRTGGSSGVGPPGFSVLRAGKALASHDFPVFCPGPGARDVPRTLLEEVPTPEPRRDLYSRPRGYPVSVSFLDAKAPAGRLSLREVGKRTDLPAHVFSPRAPLHPSFAHNYATAFLVTEEPLSARTVHEATYVVGEGPDARTFVWRFTTGDGGP